MLFVLRSWQVIDVDVHVGIAIKCEGNFFKVGVPSKRDS